MSKELPANTSLSHYRIIAPLGAGGMGEVYLAEDTQLRRKVALKVLPDSLAQDKDRLRRFEQEAFAASALNHPNILTIYEFGVAGETHFLASEFIDGETLRARLERAPLPLDEALDIAAQTAQAAAEFQKIIDHRGWDVTSPLWPLAHLGLARAAVLQGDVAKAKQMYDEFFRLWKDADADLPVLIEAKKEYARLP